MNATAPARGLRRVLVLLGVLLLCAAAAAAATRATPAAEVTPSPGTSPSPEQAAPAEATPSPGETEAAEPLVTGPTPETLGFNAGTISPTWMYLSGPPLARAYDAVATARRTVYVTGQVHQIDNPGYGDLSLAKIVDGKRAWLKLYDGPAHGSDVGAAIAARGTSIYTAGSRTTARGDTDLLLIRWDPNGKRVWTRVYDSGDRRGEWAEDVAVDTDGNVTVVGVSDSAAGYYDWVVISYKADGTRRWVRRYDGPAHKDDAPSQMVLDAQGNAYVAGYSGSALNGEDALTIKYAKSGTRLWVRRYNGPDNYTDSAYALRLRPGGGVYVVGYAHNANSDPDGLLLAYTASGRRLFATLDPGSDPLSPTFEAFNDLEVLPDGNVICGGFSSYAQSVDQYHATFAAASGARLSGTAKGTPYDDQIICMAKDAQGGVYLVGRWGTGATTRQISVERIRAGGANWVSRWPATATGANQPMAIAVNGVNAYVAGIYSYSAANEEQLLMAYVY